MNAAVMMVCLATSGTPGQEPPPVFQAPLVKVTKRTMSVAGADGTRTNHDYHTLLYNRIAVGINFIKPSDPKALDLSNEPTTYFHRKSPVGVVLEKYKGAKPAIAVVGMDVGTMAAYAGKDQTIHFFERMPTLVKLSQPEKDKKPLFTYVAEAISRGAKVKIFEGEPREAIEKHAAAGAYQVIVIDTYKLPVVTVHKELMTKEGMKMLMDKTRDDGILCYHTSNRYFDLNPIIASVAADLKFASIAAHDQAPWGTYSPQYYSSSWVMVARKAEHLADLKAPAGYDKALAASGRKFAGAEAFWSKTETNKKYIWTDKGENSFKGVYRADPAIGEFGNAMRDLEQLIVDSVGFQNEVYRMTRPVHDALMSWSAARARVLNGESSKKMEKKETKDDKK